MFWSSLLWIFKSSIWHVLELISSMVPEPACIKLDLWTRQWREADLGFSSLNARKAWAPGSQCRWIFTPNTTIQLLLGWQVESTKLHKSTSWRPLTFRRFSKPVVLPTRSTILWLFDSLSDMNLLYIIYPLFFAFPVTEMRPVSKESAMQWMVNWPSFSSVETGAGVQGGNLTVGQFSDYSWSVVTKLITSHHLVMLCLWDLGIASVLQISPSQPLSLAALQVLWWTAEVPLCCSRGDRCAAVLPCRSWKWLPIRDLSCGKLKLYEVVNICDFVSHLDPFPHC